MRGEFDNLFDLFTGPLAPVPNVLKAQFPGRLVLNLRIRVQPMPFNREIGYVTCEYPLIAAADCTGPLPTLVLHLGTEDRIACPALGIAPTPVLWVETITPVHGTPYVRAHYGLWPHPG